MTSHLPEAESPRETYDRALQRYQADLSAHERRHRLLGYAKLCLGLLLAFLIVRYVHEQQGAWLLGVVALALVLLAIVHERVLKQIKRTNVLIAFNQRGIARLENRWAGTGETGDRFLDPAHPYARDLDILGAGSLFELLCTFRTRAGEETLAKWLLAPASLDEIRARQGAVQELTNRTDFRERLFTAGNNVRLGLHPEALIAWGEREGSFGSAGLSILAFILALIWIASVVYGVLHTNYYPLLLSSFVNWVIASRFHKHLIDIVEAAEAAASDLGLLAEVLAVLEQEHFTTDKLVQLQSGLRSDGGMPSAAVKKLERIVHYLEQRENLAVRWFLGFLFYTAQLAMRAEAWRRKHGHKIRAWIAIAGEMEALTALSCYAYEHPQDTWPEMIDGRACFEAEEFAHPLLPQNNAVRNDLVLGSDLQLIVLSGPNMSGKSTFVRGIGVNAVLAQCGAPVCARRLRMSRLAIGASICVLDSLLGGVSRFYAEIKRLKLISDLADGPLPLLFLFDELLSGTNSHDRLLGTKFIVRFLTQKNAIGLVTTHDLALAQIPEEMRGKAKNYHFEDRLVDDTIEFDFKLKPGVVRTSNALKLMESIGLPTRDPEHPTTPSS